MLLVCLSGYLRYRAPRKQVLSLEERKQAIQDQMELDALKVQQRTQQAQGAVGLLRGMAQAARGAPAAERSEQVAAVPPSAPEQGQAVPRGEGQEEVRADGAAPLAALVPVPSGLPMAWPTVNVAEEQTVTPHNGRRERSRR